MYYYINYSITTRNNTRQTNCVSNKHPFDWLKFFDSFSSKWTLTDWKEISGEEYEKGKLAIGIG